MKLKIYRKKPLGLYHRLNIEEPISKSICTEYSEDVDYKCDGSCTVSRVSKEEVIRVPLLDYVYKDSNACGESPIPPKDKYWLRGTCKKC